MKSYILDNVFSVVNSQKQSVDQDNAFILSTGSNLSLLENKLINFLLSCIRMDDTAFRTVLVTYDAIYRLFDYDQKKRGRMDRIDKVVDSLKTKEIHVTHMPGSPYYTGIIPWFEICERVEDEYLDGKDLYRFKFHPDLEPYLLNLKNRFTKCNFSLIQSFRNKYSAKLFMILSTEKPGYAVSYNYGYLSFLLGYSDLDNPDKTPQFSNFRRDILDGALVELREKAGLFATVNCKKGSYRSVTNVIFTVLSKSQKARASSDIPLPDVAFCIQTSPSGDEKYCIVNVGDTFAKNRSYLSEMEEATFERDFVPNLKVISTNDF